jgi:hypothetical protein
MREVIGIVPSFVGAVMDPITSVVVPSSIPWRSSSSKYQYCFYPRFKLITSHYQCVSLPVLTHPHYYYSQLRSKRQLALAVCVD